MVTCVYVNPDTEQHWIVDYRIFDPDGDGKSKLAIIAQPLEKVKLAIQAHHRLLPA